MKTINEIVDTKDYGELTHEEVELLIEYKVERALEDARKEEKANSIQECAKILLEQRKKDSEEQLKAMRSYEPPTFMVVNYG